MSVSGFSVGFLESSRMLMSVICTQSFLFLFYFILFCFYETGSHSVALAGPEFTIQPRPA